LEKRSIGPTVQHEGQANHHALRMGAQQPPPPRAPRPAPAASSSYLLVQAVQRLQQLLPPAARPGNSARLSSFFLPFTLHSLLFPAHSLAEGSACSLILHLRPRPTSSFEGPALPQSRSSREGTQMRGKAVGTQANPDMLGVAESVFCKRTSLARRRAAISHPQLVPQLSHQPLEPIRGKRRFDPTNRSRGTARRTLSLPCPRAPTAAS